MKKRNKNWYLKQDVSVSKNKLILWTRYEQMLTLISDLPYSYGLRGGKSVTDIYMKGWKDLMFVLEFADNTDKDIDFIYPILVFINKDGDFYYKQVHSKEDFINLAGEKNWKRYVRYSKRVSSNSYKIA